jgi:hypothetical protein
LADEQAKAAEEEMLRRSAREAEIEEAKKRRAVQV